MRPAWRASPTAAQMSAGLMYRYFENKNAIVLGPSSSASWRRGARSIRQLHSSADIAAGLLSVPHVAARRPGGDESGAVPRDERRSDARSADGRGTALIRCRHAQGIAGVAGRATGTTRRMGLPPESRPRRARLLMQVLSSTGWCCGPCAIRTSTGTSCERPCTTEIDRHLTSGQWQPASDLDIAAAAASGVHSRASGRAFRPAPLQGTQQ